MLKHLSIRTAPLILLLAIPVASCHQGYRPTTAGRALVIRDSALVPGSRHFASMQAYGDFILHLPTGDQTIHCDGIPGISGVSTAVEVRRQEGEKAEVHLTRLLTHFHFDNPMITIEQNPMKESTGVLVGNEGGKLLPGRASFSQYIFLTLNGRVLANREPLVMTAT